jgi:hypothetical protein
MTPQFGLQKFRQDSHSDRLPPPLLLLVIAALGLVIVPREGLCQAPTAPDLKTIEQLMNLEGTSVSKRPERPFETASAIQVITQEDIRRSGATSIPEALQLTSNLKVAQIDARQSPSAWAAIDNTRAPANGMGIDLAIHKPYLHKKRSSSC